MPVFLYLLPPTTHTVLPCSARTFRGYLPDT